MPVLASSQQEFSDADWRAVSSGDQSKKLKLLLSAISANTTRVLTMPDADVTISAFVATLLDDANAAAFLTTLGIPYEQGSYTPTATAGTNIAALTPAACRYMRLGKFIIIVGRIAVDTTATGATDFRLSIPVATDMTSFTQLWGVGTASTVAETWAITGDASNDEMSWVGAAATASAHNVNFVCAYQKND